MPHKKNDSDVALSLTFDFEQNSQQLSWQVIVDKKNALHVKGRHAGGIYLPAGEEIEIYVTGGTDDKKLFEKTRLKIVQCCILTKPHTRNTAKSLGKQFADVSPFMSADNKPAFAVLDVGGFEKMDRSIPETNGDQSYFAYSFKSKNLLSVIPKKSNSDDDLIGRWELSFILTVEITHEEKDGKKSRYLRAFSFDPETEVGNGLSL